MIAIFPSLGWQEMFLLLVFGLLLYGRNLPDAGRSLGRVMAQLKRSFHDFKDQLDRDGQISDVKKAFKETAEEMKNVAKVPRALSNPKDALRDLTHEAMSSPLDETVDESVEEPDAGASKGDAAEGHAEEGDAGKDSDPHYDASDSGAAHPDSLGRPGSEHDDSSTPSTGSGK